MGELCNNKDTLCETIEGIPAGIGCKSLTGQMLIFGFADLRIPFFSFFSALLFLGPRWSKNLEP